jgi:hypothetical protein
MDRYSCFLSPNPCLESKLLTRLRNCTTSETGAPVWSRWSFSTNARTDPAASQRFGMLFSRVPRHREQEAPKLLSAIGPLHDSEGNRNNVDINKAIWRGSSGPNRRMDNHSCLCLCTASAKHTPIRNSSSENPQRKYGSSGHSRA